MHRSLPWHLFPLREAMGPVVIWDAPRHSHAVRFELSSSSVLEESDLKHARTTITGPDVGP